MGGSSPSLRPHRTPPLTTHPPTPPLRTAHSLSRSFVIPLASDPAGWGLSWPISNQGSICALVSGTSWNVRRGATFKRGDPRAGLPVGARGPAGVRASLGLHFWAWRGGWGPLSRNRLPAPGWEGAQSFRQGRPPLRPLCPALSCMAGPRVESEPDSAPSAEIGLLGGRRGAGRGGFGSFGKNRVTGSTGLGVLALPRACELVWEPHSPTCRRGEPLPPGTGSGWRTPGLPRR